MRFTGELGSDPRSFDVGDHVRVRYHPDHPQDAVLDQYWQTWALPTFLGIFATPFLLGGIAFAAVTLATRRRAQL